MNKLASIASESGSDATVARATQAAEIEHRRFEEWRWGYAAWLATPNLYCQEDSQIRGTLGDDAALPALELTMIGRTPSIIDPRWSILLNCWSVERLATWELPIPMRPAVRKPNLLDYAQILGAGMQLFVPWYLTWRRSFNVNEIAEHQSLILTEGHLDEWLQVRTKNRWGARRYFVMLRLFVYLELCLRRRYPERIHRRLAKLDQVFSEFFSEADRKRT